MADLKGMESDAGVMTRNGIPDPRSLDALSVSDGHQTIGVVIERDGSHFVFNQSGELVGEYRSRRQALEAINVKGHWLHNLVGIAILTAIILASLASLLVITKMF